MNKTQEAPDKAAYYAAMAREMRRLASQVSGQAAQHACKTLAAQYDELAKGEQQPTTTL